MFGGADPLIRWSHDIEIRSHYLRKDPAWQTAGGYAVKNFLELKNAQRVRQSTATPCKTSGRRPDLGHH